MPLESIWQGDGQKHHPFVTMQREAFWDVLEGSTMLCEYELCNRTFEPRSVRSRFCSVKCQNRASKHWVPKKGNSSGTIGAISELVAAIDLGRKGYEVFRAISPAASCDLIALKNTFTYRIEVRTGSKLINSSHSCYRHRIGYDRQDFLAIVLPNDTVIYEPPLPDYFD